MQEAMQQGLSIARKAGEAIKAPLVEAAPESVRAAIASVPSLVVLAAAVFVALIVLQIGLRLMFGKRKRARPSDQGGAPSQARPRRETAPPGSASYDPLRGEKRAPSAPVAAPPPTLMRDPRPGFEAAFNRAENAFMLGDMAAAKPNFQEAERIARGWSGGDPGPESFRAFSRTLLRLAEVHQKVGDLDGARRQAAEALGAVRSLADSRPGDLQAQRELAVALERVGGVAAAVGDKAAARHAWQEELTIATRLAQSQRQDPSWQRFLGVVHVLLGNLGEADARAHYDRALSYFDACEAAGLLDPQDADTRNQLRQALRRV